MLAAGWSFLRVVVAADDLLLLVRVPVAVQEILFDLKEYLKATENEVRAAAALVCVYTTEVQMRLARIADSRGPHEAPGCAGAMRACG